MIVMFEKVMDDVISRTQNEAIEMPLLISLKIEY